MIPLFPSNPDPARFANKYKSLLSCLATGITTRANLLAEFNQLLDSDAFAAPNSKGYKVGTWRLLVTQEDEKLLDDRFLDKFPERFDTNSPEFHALYSKRHVIDGFYNQIPKPIQRRILLAQTWVPWSPQMKSLLEAVPQMHRIIGVSVRTWKASHDTCQLSAYRAQSFKPEKYLEIIKEYENKVEGIFFSFDNPDAEKYFKDVKIPRIKYSPPPSLTPIQRAAVEAQILGNCGLIIGDKLSTFPEVAWWLGQCRADIILVT